MIRSSVILLIIFFHSIATSQQLHPNLIMTQEGIKEIRLNLGNAPLFDKSYQSAYKWVNKEIKKGIEVPLPKDLAGGYTHERHKANFFVMQKAGILFQITLDEKYAIYIRDMLLKYAELFPTFKKHPATRSYARGKFFWQCLNDANWLVYVSQAYDCIYEWLDESTKQQLNKELFRPYAEFISTENPQFFNRIHNHSTWGNAAVGMIGLVMNDKELIEWSLYGLNMEVLRDYIKDNDGGLIKLKEQKEAGFFAQINHSFSPDGYYTEGPYYQRYAIYPFLVFAQSLANKLPELKIIEYRDKILIKAVYALINQTNSKGEFFPINDAQKGMSLHSRELVNAVCMAYYYGGKDPQLLSIIQYQDKVVLNHCGLLAAMDVAKGKAMPYNLESLYLTDGKDGNQGGIGILRKDDLTLVLKSSKHGMGHGHFDRLNFLLYDNGKEVFQDYGSARWVNIDHKDGGGYLKENKTWSKQTIAHNSIVINRQSQFEADIQKAEQSYPNHHFFDTSSTDIQVMSAIELNAYSNWTMCRTMAILNLKELESPLVLDLISLVNSSSDKNSLATFDMPLYYQGELMSTNIEIVAKNILTPMGDSFGYQHLWLEAEAVPTEPNFKMTWFNKDRFYSVTSTINKNDNIYFTRIGANDPNFNLRRDPGLIINRRSGSTLFAQVYESHGNYNTSSEIPINSFTSVESLKILHHSTWYGAIEIVLKSDQSYVFCYIKNTSRKNEKHSLKINDKEIEWEGNFYLYKSLK